MVVFLFPFLVLLLLFEEAGKKEIVGVGEVKRDGGREREEERWRKRDGGREMEERYGERGMRRDKRDKWMPIVTSFCH